MTAGKHELSSDGRLIAMICSGNHKDYKYAWERIYDENRPRMKALVRRLNISLEHFTDIYHDSLAALMRNIETQKFEFKSSISTYLYGICRNHCCNKFKIDRRALQAEKAFGEDLSMDEEYDAQRDALWHRVSLIFANELKEECREILIKFYFEGQSMKQLMEHFNVNSEQAAKNKKCAAWSICERL